MALPGLNLPSEILRRTGPLQCLSALRQSGNTPFPTEARNLSLQKELLRHADIQATKNIYTQAVTLAREKRLRYLRGWDLAGNMLIWNMHHAEKAGQESGFSARNLLGTGKI
ncbi:MAG: hypothetical protein ACRD3D_14260 [Terriglobia bacterium]